MCYWIIILPSVCDFGSSLYAYDMFDSSFTAENEMSSKNNSKNSRKYERNPNEIISMSSTNGSNQNQIQ